MAELFVVGLELGPPVERVIALLGQFLAVRGNLRRLSQGKRFGGKSLDHGQTGERGGACSRVIAAASTRRHVERIIRLSS